MERPPRPVPDAGFTLDDAVLAQRQQASSQRLHTLQVPALRLGGFAILCVVLLLHDLRAGVTPEASPLRWLAPLNLAYALGSWWVLRRWYRRGARVDLALVMFHLDLLVWLPNLYHLEERHLFFAYFLLVRVIDQIGEGFRRALYFCHLILLAYLGYSLWVAGADPARAQWGDRAVIAMTMYLLGWYIASTGLVAQRLRERTREAVRTARDLVDTLAQKAQVLQAQAAELEQARGLAEQASVAKSQFLAVASHEIRTPMTAILGSTELLLGTPMSESQHRYARTAHRSATALLALIDDVLDLSRIEARKLTLQAAPVDLRVLAGEAVELIAVTARGKPIALGWDASAQLPVRVMADPQRLRQMIVNLLHNAVKFTERGRVRLTLTLLDTPAGAPRRWRLSVHDTGIGIAPDMIEPIFGAFAQADGSTTRRYGGSGLGLAIVKELAQLMDGELGVRSTVGEGSHFWVDLPLVEAPPATEASTQPADLDDEPRNGRAALRVLLAEDDPVNQMVVKEMLVLLGCEVDLVADGQGAREAAARGGHDIVFMDCHMPGTDGYEATLHIRDDERERGAERVPIVALTADALLSDRERCIEAGMNDFMTKPVSRSQLAVMIERWTGRRTRRAERW